MKILFNIALELRVIIIQPKRANRIILKFNFLLNLSQFVSFKILTCFDKNEA